MMMTLRTRRRPRTVLSRGVPADRRNLNPRSGAVSPRRLRPSGPGREEWSDPPWDSAAPPGWTDWGPGEIPDDRPGTPPPDTHSPRVPGNRWRKLTSLPTLRAGPR